MSVLGIVAIGWVALNAVIFTALLLRRPRPELPHPSMDSEQSTGQLRLLLRRDQRRSADRPGHRVLLVPVDNRGPG